MAITLDTNLPIEGGLFSLNSPFSLPWTKDANTTDTLITINITQNAFTKTIELKYSGLIKAVSLDIVNLVKDYYQNIETATPTLTGAVLMYYDEDRFMTVEVIVGDSDGDQTYTQNFVNSIGTSRIYNGYLVPEPSSKTINIFNNTYLNVPLNIYLTGAFTALVETIDFVLYDSTGTPVYNETILDPQNKQTTVIPLLIAEDKVTLEFTYKATIDLQVVTHVATYTVITESNCLKGIGVEVYYQDEFGGVNNIFFPSYKLRYNKIYKDYILQSKEKIRINNYERKAGTLNTSVLLKSENDKIQKFALSEKASIKADPNNEDFSSPTGYIDILLTNPTFAKKLDYSTVTPITYTLPFEEVFKINR